MIKCSVKLLQALWKSGALAFHCGSILLTSPLMRSNNFQRILLQREAVVSSFQMLLSLVFSRLELCLTFTSQRLYIYTVIYTLSYILYIYIYIPYIYSKVAFHEKHYLN